MLIAVAEPDAGGKPAQRHADAAATPSAPSRSARLPRRCRRSRLRQRACRRRLARHPRGPLEGHQVARRRRRWRQAALQRRRHGPADRRGVPRHERVAGHQPQARLPRRAWRSWRWPACPHAARASRCAMRRAPSAGGCPGPAGPEPAQCGRQLGALRSIDARLAPRRRRLSFTAACAGVCGASDPAVRRLPTTRVALEHQHPELHHARTRHVRSGDLLAAADRPDTRSPSSCSSAPASAMPSTAISPSASTGRTELGAYLDPLADKLLIVSIFIALGVRGELPLWLVIAVVSRDILIVAGRAAVLAAGPAGAHQAAGRQQGQHGRADRAGRHRAGRRRLRPWASTRRASCWCGLREL